MAHCPWTVSYTFFLLSILSQAMRQALKQEWETLNDKQKREYTLRFEDAASSYAQRVKEWQAKLIKDGYGDVSVRTG